ncbi:MAG TPA: hypothetical protein VFM90_01110 [Cyclobacteriaceae bacterium]|nr:hypothetical protein [Cyclobacteriaceae bacterium]
MFKFLIIIVLVGYVLMKIGSFFFRAGAASQQGRFKQPRKPGGGNVNIDSMPNDKQRKGAAKGGDYVDYEEIK